MTLVYGYTKLFHNGVRKLPKQQQQAIREKVNAIGTSIKQDFEATHQTLSQPTPLQLKHQYTPTLYVLSVSKEIDVLLCYDRDVRKQQILISLLAVAPPEKSKGRFDRLATAIYGPLLLRD